MSGNSPRPKAMQTAKSFSRYEPASSSSPQNRSRSSSLQQVSTPPIIHFGAVESPMKSDSDVDPSDPFDLGNTEHEAEGTDGGDEEVHTHGFDELPVEIQSLVERFLESLSAKVHPAPPSVDSLSELFQNFYEHTSTQIGTHISALAIQMARDQSPAPSFSSGGSQGSRGAVKKSAAIMDAAQHQMLTASEISDRRKVRRQLETKRIALEDAVECAVCEKIYPRLWRHRTTDDEARDEKLRSRAAALSLVGVGLHELLSTALSDNVSIAKDLNNGTGTDDAARIELTAARSSLEAMNNDRSPLGKLNCLKDVHKNIVEALQRLFPSVSSADEVLPALIYTAITSSPDHLHLVSNFNFIQRFRSSSKIDGEAAYCLTNLEATIAFLETIDLSSIRAEERPAGPSKLASAASIPRTDTPDPLYHGLPTSEDRPQADNSSAIQLPVTPTSTRNRSLSKSIRAKSIGAATDAADSALDTIHGALGSSFKFLFGRLREEQANATPHGSPKMVAAPKTLEDARKLVTTDGSSEEDAGGNSPNPEPADNPDAPSEDRGKFLNMIGGRRTTITRERAPSTDSAMSGGSGKRVAFAEGKPLPRDISAPSIGTDAGPTAGPSVPSAYTPLESVRNLGTSLNPLKGFAGMGAGMMRGFGRVSPAAPSTPSAVQEAEKTVASEPLRADLRGAGPPLKRFVEMGDAREMNFFDIELLLRDYQRLAGMVKAAGVGDPV